MNEKARTHCTAKAILTCVVTCIGASITYGYNLIVLNLPGDNIKCFLRQTILEETSCSSQNGTADDSLDQKEALLYALLNASHTLFATISALSCGWLADTIGRRNGLILTEIPAILGAIVSTFTVKLRHPLFIYIGRCLIGINAGFSVGFASMYLTEIAPKSRRGVYGICHSISSAFGNVIAVILTLSNTFNTETLWPIACGLSGVASFIAIIILPFCPESPRHVYFKDKERAHHLIKELFHEEYVDEVIQELEAEEATLKSNKFKFTQLFTEKKNRKKVIMVCVMPVIQQLAATSVVINYSSTFLKTAGMKIEHSQYFVLGLMIFQCFCVILACFSVEKAGRRKLILFSLVFVTICLGSLSVTINVSNAHKGSNRSVFVYLTLAFVALYVITYTVGISCIPQLLVSELFCQEARGTAYSLSQAMNNLSKLIVLVTFPTLNQTIGGYSFTIYFFCGCIGCVYVYLKVPETTNRTFLQNAQEIEINCPVV